MTTTKRPKPAKVKTPKKARPDPKPVDGWCSLSGCSKAWRTHAMGEQRLHRRLIAAGHTHVPDIDDEDDG